MGTGQRPEGVRCVLKEGDFAGEHAMEYRELL